MNKTVCNTIPIIVPPMSLQKKFGETIMRFYQQKALLSSNSKNSVILFEMFLQNHFS